MKFDSESKNYVHFKKNGHILTKECTVYLNKDIPLFGILENEGYWFFFHLVSEFAFYYKFPCRKDIEIFFDFLNQQTDLNSIFLILPDFKKIMEQNEFKLDIDIAYKKFIRFKIKGEFYH